MAVAERNQRRALLSYVKEPFSRERDHPGFRKHANWWRALKIAELIKDRGYEVDVVEWTDEVFEGTGYDLVIGLGVAFDRALRLNKRAVSIYLGTGAHWRQNNGEVLKRQRAFKKHHRALPRVQMVPKDRSCKGADFVGVVGNDWVMDTYRRCVKGKVMPVVNSVTEGVSDTTGGKDYLRARRRFLWMAAYGVIRRRLDVVLDVFSTEPDLDLCVCGSVEWEKEFFSIYKELLTNGGNIVYNGWVDVGSEEYRSVTRASGFLIYPSVSDGLPGSVVNAMASGVVPIVTREAGIDVGDFGILLNSGSEEDIREGVRQASEMPEGELRERSEMAVFEARKKYTKSAFIQSFEALLDVGSV